MPMAPPAIPAPGSRFQESRIFLTAAELDLFTLLADNHISAREMAERLQVTLRGITVLLDAVARTDLLEKKEGEVQLPGRSGVLIVRGIAGLDHARGDAQLGGMETVVEPTAPSY